MSEEEVVINIERLIKKLEKIIFTKEFISENNEQRIKLYLCYINDCYSLVNSKIKEEKVCKKLIQYKKYLESKIKKEQIILVDMKKKKTDDVIMERNYFVDKLLKRLKEIEEEEKKKRIREKNVNLNDDYSDDYSDEDNNDNDDENIKKLISDVGVFSSDLKQHSLAISDMLDSNKEVLESNSKTLDSTLHDVKKSNKSLMKHYDVVKKNCCSMFGLTVLFFLIMTFCIIIIRIFPKRSKYY